MNIRDCSFAVIDCETTGFHPSAYHRVIELAIVQVSCAGEIGETWTTLLRPDRDLGPTEVHGIRGRELLDAPRFEDVAGHVVDRLAGRVVVAHNATFDCTFLQAELARALAPIEPISALCTLRLAHARGRSGRGRLVDCCAAEGIAIDHAHTAEDDARACAALLAAWLPQLDGELARFGVEDPWPVAAWPTLTGRADPVRRRTAPSPSREPDFVGLLVQDLSPPSGHDAVQVTAYIELLDRALEDRRLSPAEQDDLAQMAALLGLTAQRVRELHTDYVATLVALALRDRVITDRERADLELVAEALGVDDLDAMLAATSALEATLGARSLTGQSVCFTGALLCNYNGETVTRELAEELAGAAGLVVRPSVTKGLDLLVVADPHSMSGKAKKARQYGTRIVAESAFWPMIGVDMS